MTETSPQLDAARLDELAKVTKDYSKYSRGIVGWMAVLLGAWYIALDWLRVTRPGWAILQASLTPLAIVAGREVARRAYQRMGVVIEIRNDRASSAIPWLLVYVVQGVVFLAGKGIHSRPVGPTWARMGGVSGWAASAVAVAAWLLPLIFQRRFVRDSRGGALLVSAVALVMITLRQSPETYPSLTTLGGALLMAAGLVGHVRYLLLRRRLATLKEPRG